MANNYRHSGKKMPVASASGAITSGSLVWQEGILGVAVTDAAAGKSLTIDTTGVWVLPVPAGTVKGDRLSATLGADSVAVTLARGIGAVGDALVGLAAGDRDADGKALVLLARQPLVMREV